MGTWQGTNEIYSIFSSFEPFNSFSLSKLTVNVDIELNTYLKSTLHFVSGVDDNVLANNDQTIMGAL
jgi:hypothetical protein